MFLLVLVITHTFLYSISYKNALHSYRLSYWFLHYLCNLSHRLTELNISLFYLRKLSSFENIYCRQPHVNVKTIKLNFIQQICLRNSSMKQDNSYGIKWNKEFFLRLSFLAKSFNQIIYCFLTNCFTFLTKFRMAQVRKPHFEGISAPSVVLWGSFQINK